MENSFVLKNIKHCDFWEHILIGFNCFYLFFNVVLKNNYTNMENDWK